jgi:hypothetical protein
LSALIVGLAGVLGTNAFIAFVVPFPIHGPVVAFTLIVAFIVVVSLRPRFYLTAVPALVFWVPMLTHLYTLIAGLVSGVIFEPTFLLFVSLVMIAVAFALHRPTIRALYQSSVLHEG